MLFGPFRFSRYFWGILPLLLSLSGLWGQTKPVEGLRERPPQVHALTNARIVPVAGAVIEKGTVVLRDGVIVAVGAEVAVPADARVWDYSGKTIYPGLIDVFSDLGMSAPEDQRGGRSSDEGELTLSGPHHWNEKVRAETAALQQFSPGKKDLDRLRQMGFTAAWVVPQTGIFRGNSAVVSLNGSDLSAAVIRDEVAQHLTFQRGGSGYPSSLMGIIALIRQTLLDAEWYARAREAYRQNPHQPAPETNAALAALEKVIRKQQSVVFAVGDDLEFLRAQKIIEEFGLRARIKASGWEYRQIAAVRAANFPLILPLNFPETLHAATPEDVLDLELGELQHWYLAPENPRRLYESGLQISFTRDGLDAKQDFYAQLRQTIERGLPESAALAALTQNPAKMLGIETELGSIAPGKRAHLLVTDGDLFAKDRKIIDVWVDGQRHAITPLPEVDPLGKWQAHLNLPGAAAPLSAELNISGKPEKFSARLLTADSTEIRFTRAEADHRRLFFSLPGDSLGHPGVMLLSAALSEKTLHGTGLLPDGQRFEWQATWQEALPEKASKSAQDSTGKWDYRPQMMWDAYGRSGLPEQPAHLLVKNATIWTSGPQGRLANADMLVSGGRIAGIGANLTAPDGAVIIDATGKHLTPGLIDAHSHSGIDRGVNEGTQAVTAEVRIGDVVDSYDIAFYRELAGGLTVANQLHGSANPIGGQNSVIKLRWGAPPDGLKIADAIPGIKFALGENVKQSNWGDNYTSRYPQTRMGVETLIRDRFKAARDYENAWQRYRSLSKKEQARTIPPRRDLELDALLEILRGERLIHCHSYRQDEILMLCRVAQEFGFTIGTFQHVLEGYKVAEAIRETAIGASTFSDWWAYKFEVYDAIPFNGTLMTRAGVNVSFNSDSNELARRLNTEAAKAVKYGGLPPEEALKLVTINPARQLKIDHRTGSLEPGKDADFVIWNGDPLSAYSLCEQTWIEGRKYFDRTEDQALRQQVAAERAELLQRYLRSGKKGNGGPKSPAKKEPGEYSCRHEGTH